MAIRCSSASSLAYLTNSSRRSPVITGTRTRIVVLAGIAAKFNWLCDNAEVIAGIVARSKGLTNKPSPEMVITDMDCRGNVDS